MNLSRPLRQVFERITRLIQGIEFARDFGEGITPDEAKTLEILHFAMEKIRESPHFREHELNVAEDIAEQFNYGVVTPEWIKTQLKQNNISQRELAAALDVQEAQISKWLSGIRNPNVANKAAIYYFFTHVSQKS